MKYLFGPVNSRRLGLSLGVDLVGRKTCSLDCVYCESGPTTRLTAEAAGYLPAQDVIDELDAYLSERPRLDVITFSGAGEPLLNSGIGDVIEFLKNTYPEYKICVLTNGTLLKLPEVRARIMRADIVIPSLDAASENVFRKMLRPHPDISASGTIEGIKAFSSEFRGTLIVEVFILPGYNDSASELSAIRDACISINPHSVQLNSLDRPGSVEGLLKADGERLASIAEMFGPLRVDIPPLKNTTDGSIKPASDAGSEVMKSIARRPATAADVASMSGLTEEQAEMVLERLCEEGKAERAEMESGVFYRPAGSNAGQG